MVETIGRSTLEMFTHPVHSFLHVVDDPVAIHDVLQLLPTPYGLEVGFGKEPTQIFHIDPSIPWILTEPDVFRFKCFQEESQHNWLDEPDSSSIIQPVIALNTVASIAMQEYANTLVYRNISYQDMEVISFADLRPKQRFVFIVDNDHIPEVPMYGSFLRKHGYDVSQFRRRALDVPQFTYPYPFYPNDYVLDVTK